MTQTSEVGSVGAVMCSSSIRWGFQLLQAAPLALGLMGLFLAALLRGREMPAFITGSLVVWLKLTLGLPLLAVALASQAGCRGAGGLTWAPSSASCWVSGCC